jgi:HD-GYP domain-containing protein (c-di-GMP phosphodiesterase class II)
MLHDVGKVHVPDEILKKPSRLTAEEYEVMKLHPVDGEAMLAADPALASAARIVRSHHERFDGAGYPDGLVGRDIPLASRIIAVCDAFDAMTNDRQYRKAMGMQMAFAILREHSGSQWDERVVEQVMAVVATMPSADAFGAVGRASQADFGEMIPDDIRDLLVAVDAEI